MKAIIIYPESFREPTVFEFPIDDYPEIKGLITFGEMLDQIFRQCNHVDGNEWIEGKKLRSMSVGDMVVLTERGSLGGTKNIFVCCGVGWKEVTQLGKTYENYSSTS